MKKAKLVAAAGILAFSLFYGIQFRAENVKAGEQIMCELESTEGKRGETVSVTVKVNSNPGTIMSETRFAYDSDVVEVLEVREEDLFRTPEMGNITSDYQEPNPARNPIQLTNGFLAYQGNSNNTGYLYTIYLKIKDDAPIGRSEISFYGKFYDWEFNEYEVECNLAEVKVTCLHNFVAEVFGSEPTCTEPGSKYGVCNICGEILSTTLIPASGHQFSAWNVSVAATYTQAGREETTCTVCGLKQTREIAALGHNTDESTVIKEPTYTEDGLKTDNNNTDNAKSDMNTNNAAGSNTNKSSVKTGDSPVMLEFIGIMALAGLAVIVGKKSMNNNV